MARVFYWQKTRNQREGGIIRTEYYRKQLIFLLPVNINSCNIKIYMHNLYIQIMQRRIKSVHKTVTNRYSFARAYLHVRF